MCPPAFFSNAQSNLTRITLQKIDQPAYRLAVSVCNTAADRLQRHVCQYFSDLLTGGSNINDDSDSDEPSTSNTKSDDNLRQSHDLVARLHRSCPNVLPSVIPILEAELRSDKLNARVIATQTVGQMLADKGGPEFVRKYPTTFQAWITRKADVSVQVRLKLVEGLLVVLPNLPEAHRALEGWSMRYFWQESPVLNGFFFSRVY